MYGEWDSNVKNKRWREARSWCNRDERRGSKWEGWVVIGETVEHGMELVV